MSGLLNAGTLVARNVAGSTLFVDDSTGSIPVLNVAHTWAAGTVNISAGANPSQGFSVAPTAGNSQVLSGPNLNISNTFSVASANISNGLAVTGPTTLAGPTAISGNLSVVGAANVVNNLSVGNTVSVPALVANTILASGPTANAYVETKSIASSNTAALYLSNSWRLKVVQSGNTTMLATQTFSGNAWVNASVVTPPGLALSINTITTTTT